MNTKPFSVSHRCLLAPFRACVLLLLGLAGLTIAADGLSPKTGPAHDTAEPSPHQIAMSVLDDFMRTFSARDARSHVATYHFPHYRLARGEMAVFATIEEGEQAHRALFTQLPTTGWHRSEWVSREIVGVGPSKIHVATRFRRLREDGSVIGEFDSLYILTSIDGRWGVRMRSSFL